MTMSNSDLAQRFAAGHTKGEASNMYIEGDTIYSYGSHFPIAKKIAGGYLVNSDDYSPTTSQHKGHVINALSGKIWKTHECDQRSIVEYQTEEIYKALKKIPRARRYFKWYADFLHSAIKEVYQASDRFGLSIQPLYDVFLTPEAGKAIKRMQRDDAIFPGLVELFGKSQFLGKKELNYTAHTQYYCYNLNDYYQNQQGRIIIL